MNALAYPAGTGTVEVMIVEGDQIKSGHDLIAAEVPVALNYNNSPFVVMMATPQQLDDFAYGFSLSEQLVDSLDEIGSVAVSAIAPDNLMAGFEIAVQIPPARHAALVKQQRNLLGRSGCGLCGIASIEAAIRPPRQVTGNPVITAKAIERALQEITPLQSLNRLTGALHAAAWCTPQGAIDTLCEDVGRHNALDKLIGQHLRADCDFTDGFVLITSRASHEMVQKAASVGIAIVVAVSAPTLAAIQLANTCGITLIGFARSNRCLIYSHPQRLVAPANSCQATAS